MRANRLMWFAAGAVTMATFLQGPNALVERGYALAGSLAVWANSLI